MHQQQDGQTHGCIINRRGRGVAVGVVELHATLHLQSSEKMTFLLFASNFVATCNLCKSQMLICDQPQQQQHQEQQQQHPQHQQQHPQQHGSVGQTYIDLVQTPLWSEQEHFLQNTLGKVGFGKQQSKLILCRVSLCYRVLLGSSTTETLEYVVFLPAAILNLLLCLLFIPSRHRVAN